MRITCRSIFGPDALVEPHEPPDRSAASPAHVGFNGRTAVTGGPMRTRTHTHRKEVNMSRTFHRGERRIRVRQIRRDPPDLRKVAKALIALAQAQAELDAEQSKTAAAPTTDKGADRPTSSRGSAR